MFYETVIYVSLNVLHYGNMNQGSSIYLLDCGLHDQVISVCDSVRRFSRLQNIHTESGAQKLSCLVSVCGHFPSSIMPDLCVGASGFIFLQGWEFSLLFSATSRKFLGLYITFRKGVQRFFPKYVESLQNSRLLRCGMKLFPYRKPTNVAFL